jgi:hypothetical protein
MARHKWKPEIEYVWGSKPHTCVKCGLEKYWKGGDYQCWVYVRHTESMAMNGTYLLNTKETFIRQECGG